jgi:hypothetical protein
MSQFHRTPPVELVAVLLVTEASMMGTTIWIGSREAVVVAREPGAGGSDSSVISTLIARGSVVSSLVEFHEVRQLDPS